MLQSGETFKKLFFLVKKSMRRVTTISATKTGSYRYFTGKGACDAVSRWVIWSCAGCSFKLSMRLKTLLACALENDTGKRVLN